MKVRLKLPSSPCSHIQIEYLDGSGMTVMTLEELMAMPAIGEDLRIIRMKYLVKDYVAAGGSILPNAVKTFLELKDL